MTTQTTPQLELEHPAKWSASVLEVLSELYAAHADPAPGARRIVALDPFAGRGRTQLAAALDRCTPDGEESVLLTGVEIQPEWARADQSGYTMVGDATDLRSEWFNTFDLVVSSPCYGNRMADSHDAKDTCKACDGEGKVERVATPAEVDAGHELGVAYDPCKVCKGRGNSWRNTYAHALRRAGAEPAKGSAATMQWGHAYRRLHEQAMAECIDVLREGGLILWNIKNHVRDAQVQLVAEWHLNTWLRLGCQLLEVRRAEVRGNRQGANGHRRSSEDDDTPVREPVELVMALTAPNPRKARTLL